MKLAIVELFNPLLHGIEPSMENHYLLSYEINNDEFINGDYNEILNSMRLFYNDPNNSDKLIKYSNISKNDKYYSLNIVEPILKNNVVSCVLKTHNISLFQRKFKKYILWIRTLY
jgi:hypothetical protein